MSAEILTLADAVVEALNAEAFQETLAEEFTAARLYVAAFELPDMNILHVSVVPRGLTEEIESRDDASDYQYRIDVAIQKKPPKLDATNLDPLMALAEQIVALLKTATIGDASCVRVDHVAVYSPDHMEQFRQFTSVLTFTFKVVR